MALTLSMNAAGEFIIVSDKRKHAAVPAVTQDFHITTVLSGKNDDGTEYTYSDVFSGTRELKPATPEYIDPIVSVTDDSGVIWVVKSDDGITAVYRRTN